MERKPIIAIYKEGQRYRVEIEGEEIERLRSFEILVSNEPKLYGGIREWPFYRIEQYLPAEQQTKIIRDAITRTLKQPAEQSEETPGSQDRTSS